VRRLPGDPDAACQRIGQGALNAERACRPSAWWQAARPLHNKCRGCTTLWASRQAHPVGLRHGPLATRQQRVSALSGEHRVRPGHVSALDPCMRRGPLRPGTLLRPGPYSEGPGALPRARHVFLRAPDLYAQGSDVLLWRSGPSNTSWDVLPFLATRCL
jgi:hypothetical protein